MKYYPSANAAAFRKLTEEVDQAVEESQVDEVRGSGSGIPQAMQPIGGNNEINYTELAKSLIEFGTENLEELARKLDDKLDVDELIELQSIITKLSKW